MLVCEFMAGRHPTCIVTGLQTIDATRLVPGQADISLAITIERERIAVRVKIEIVRIAKAVVDDRTNAKVMIGSQQKTGVRRFNKARLGLADRIGRDFVSA